MKKKLIFEVEEGYTTCRTCPISEYCQENETLVNIPCGNYDLSTLKFIGEEDYDNEH